MVGQPVIEGQEIGGHRAEGAHLPSYAAVRFGQQETGDDTLLMDIETATAGMHDLHTSSSATGDGTVRSCGMRTTTSFPPVLIAEATATIVVAGSIPESAF